MKDYTENKFHLYRTNISFSDRDTLIIERKTPLSYRKETIALTAFSPTPAVIAKKPGAITKFLFKAACVCIVIFLVILYRNPELNTIVNVPLCYLFVLVFAALSALYYFITTKSILDFRFYWDNSQSCFTLLHLKDNEEQIKFIDAFNLAVRNARVNFDQNNFKSIEKGINNLEKQGIIGPSFAGELQHRVSLLMNTSI